MKGQFNNNRKFGVEIEFLFPLSLGSRSEVARKIGRMADVRTDAQGYNHRLPEDNGGYYWKLTTDVTVHNTNGTPSSMYQGQNELVSPPLKGREGLAELKRVLNAMDELGCVVNYKCGIHIHHDLPEWRTAVVSNRMGQANGKQMINLINLVRKYETVLYRLQPRSRRIGGRNNSYCRPIDQAFPSSLVESWLSNPAKVRELRSNFSRRNFDNYGYDYQVQSTRYCGLNFYSLWRHGTVEFRYMAGSVNYEKISNWIVLTQAIIETALVKQDYVTGTVRYNTDGELRTNMSHFKMILGISTCGMMARNGVERDDLNTGCDAWMNARISELS